MITYIFRSLTPGWRPKTASDLLNRKLVRIWVGKPVEVLANITGRE
jgi:hypothetical protein